MRVLVAALLLCALLVPGVSADSTDSDCVPKGDVQFCSEDYRCDHESGICRYHAYCVYVFEWANCTHT